MILWVRERRIILSENINFNINPVYGGSKVVIFDYTLTEILLAIIVLFKLIEWYDKSKLIKWLKQDIDFTKRRWKNFFGGLF